MSNPYSVMLSVFKGVKEKETNYDDQELIESCVNTVKPNQDWSKAEPFPTIPETIEEKFPPIEIGLNGFRHDAMIFDLEADDLDILQGKRVKQLRQFKATKKITHRAHFQLL